MANLSRFLADRLAAKLAIGTFVSVVLLSWFGYRAIAEWRNTSLQLASRRAVEAVDLVRAALSRDMSGAQEAILTSPEWTQFHPERPQDVEHLVSSAFARYPYPQSFFAWQEGGAYDALVFFNRSDRRPPWAPMPVEPNRFPVEVVRAPEVAARISEGILADAAHSHQLSVFDLQIDGATYQIVAQLTYGDIYRQRLSRFVGFAVDLRWVKEHYFSDLASEFWQIGPGSEEWLTFSVLDAAGQVVAGAPVLRESALTQSRALPLRFVATDADADRERLASREVWSVLVSASEDPSLARAYLIANRMLMVGAASAIALVIGLALTVRAERVAARLAQMRSDFVSTVTHEIKTPIATIQAAAETLSRDRLGGMTYRTCGRIVSMETKRLSHLVENLLAYSRITDVADTYAFEALDVAVIFGDVQQAFEALLDQRGFELEMTMAPDLPRVRGDRRALRLLFDNLVDNAIKYSRDQPTLLLAARATGRTVTFDVVDSGVGIAEDELPLVTKKFVRGRDAGASGSGLGLTIANRIAKDHGGTLTIRSVLGVGTTVTVTLPAAQPSEEAMRLDHLDAIRS